MAQSPFSLASKFLVDRLASVVNDAATSIGGGGRIPAMMAARRNIRPVPLPPDPSLARAAMQDAGVGQSVQNAISDGRVVAAYEPSSAGSVGRAVFPEGNQGLMSHEMNHGYWDAAQRDATGMPLFMRWLSQRIPDEGPEQLRGRALMNMFGEVASQMKEGTRFTDIPADTYMNLHANDRELAEAFALLKRIQGASEATAQGGLVYAGLTPAFAAMAMTPEME